MTPSPMSLSLSLSLSLMSQCLFTLLSVFIIVDLVLYQCVICFIIVFCMYNDVSEVAEWGRPDVVCWLSEHR